MLRGPCLVGLVLPFLPLSQEAGAQHSQGDPDGEEGQRVPVGAGAGCGLLRGHEPKEAEGVHWGTAYTSQQRAKPLGTCEGRGGARVRGSAIQVTGV